MNIAVIAANGRSGQAFVAAALAHGHTVRAGVHGHDPFTKQKNLETVPCDARDLAQVSRLVAGQDAIVSLIGHVKGSPARVQTEAMGIVADAMLRWNVKRLVSLTGTGVRFEGDRIGPVDRALNLTISVIDPERVRDGIEHVEVLKQSDLDWSVIRVLKLTNAKPKPFTLTEHGPTKWSVGRAEVAEAILEVLEKETFVRQAPIISPRHG